MAPNLNSSVSLRILFDKGKNQVICAEAGSDFVDILFSLLTLPMGTIVRLLQKQKSSNSAQIGCITNLYQSVKDLSLDIFSTDPCTEMLMYPKNSFEHICKDLIVNVNDTPIRYFLCADMSCRHRISYYKNAKCFCGKLLNSEAFESNPDGQEIKVEKLNTEKDMIGVFVKRSTTYIVTDDMKVMPGTPGSLIEVFRVRGVKNVNLVEEKLVKVGPDEILNLLMYILLSKTPLTDSFLPNQKVNSKNIPGKEGDHHVASNVTLVDASEKSMEIKIFVSKANKKPLYAEAMEDFVELLLNFLRFPLSNVVSLFSFNTSLGCVDNLYKSVQELDSKWFVKKQTCLSLKDLVLCPGITRRLYHSSDVSVHNDFNLRIIDRIIISKMGEIRRVNINSYIHSLAQGEAHFVISNALAKKWTYWSSNFLKVPSLFTLSDSLVIKPCDDTSINISFLKSLDVPIDDIEEHKMKIGMQQVLSILKASLTTNSALSPLMDLLSKNPK